MKRSHQNKDNLRTLVIFIMLINFPTATTQNEVVLINDKLHFDLFKIPLFNVYKANERKSVRSIILDYNIFSTKFTIRWQNKNFKSFHIIPSKTAIIVHS